ncbi:MAG: hypothetical protein AB1489_41195 [Acidobacteriota bacterium]
MYMQRVLFIALLILLITPVTFTKHKNYRLPQGAKVIEIQPIRITKLLDRVLILWMHNPEKQAIDPTDPYTCPDETRGDHYEGPTRVSLFNTKDEKIVNTIEVKCDILKEEEDTFHIPYKIHSDLYYQVKGVTKGKAGKPTIMSLKDYNGDGKAVEFVLFDKINCMTLLTSLIGYSETQDKVIQYPIVLDVEDNGKIEHQVSFWEDGLFNEKPVKPGYWKYDLDYRGRGGVLVKYEIRYNKDKEIFEGRSILQSDSVMVLSDKE